MARSLEQNRQEELSTAETQATIRLLAEKYQAAMQEELKAREESNVALKILRACERRTKAAAQNWAEKHQFLLKFPKAMTTLTEMEQGELDKAQKGQHHD